MHGYIAMKLKRSGITHKLLPYPFWILCLGAINTPHAICNCVLPALWTPSIRWLGHKVKPRVCFKRVAMQIWERVLGNVERQGDINCTGFCNTCLQNNLPTALSWYILTSGKKVRAFCGHSDFHRTAFGIFTCFCNWRTQDIYNTVPANFRNYFHFQHPQTFTRSSLRTKNPKQKMKNWLQNIWNSFFPSWLCKKWGWGRTCRLTGWNQWAKCETTHPPKKPAEEMFWNMHQILFLVLTFLHDYQKIEGLM